MKRELLFPLSAALLFILTNHTFAQDLDENLLLLKPFLNQVWVGEMEGIRGEGTIRSEREWTIIWNGKAVKYTSFTDKLNVYSDAYYFWDSDKKEIALFSLSSNGNFLQGHVKAEDGKILMYGFITLSNAKLEFKNYFEFTEDGNLIDNWFRFEDNEWKPGHARVLHPKGE